MKYEQEATRTTPDSQFSAQCKVPVKVGYSADDL